MPQSATNLLLHVDPRSKEPLQHQIYSGIRRSILEGVVRPGTRLPSSRALARDLGISRTTSLLALEQLLAEGYLTTQHGSGTFVASELPDDLPHKRDSGRTQKLKHPRISRRSEALAAVPPVAERIMGTPRPFRFGSPALDLFPVELWSRLASRRLRSVTTTQLDYGSLAGIEPLREAIADHVSTARGTRCTAEQVQVVNGAQAGLGIICSLLLDPGDTAWMEEPGYPGARSALVASGARVVAVPVDEDGLDVEAGARRAADARVVYVTPSHQFPLGVPMSLARRLALLSWARASQAWVIEDDYDSEFRFGARPLPCLHGLDVDGRVIYVGSFAKTLFPALRLGFIIVPPDLAKPILGIRRAWELQSPILEQMTLAEFIRAGHFERHLRRMRAEYRERLEALFAAAERHCAGAMQLRATRTGLHVVADVDGVDDVRVFREAAARGVEVMPLSSFYLDKSRPGNGLVLGFAGIRPDAMNRGMKALAAAIEAARRP